MLEWISLSTHIYRTFAVSQAHEVTEQPCPRDLGKSNERKQTPWCLGQLDAFQCVPGAPEGKQGSSVKRWVKKRPCHLLGSTAKLEEV